MSRPSSSHASSSSPTAEKVDDNQTGLHVDVHRGYQALKSEYWWDTITKNAKWYRVKYKSGRFQKECETPCWTTFFGGRSEYRPYEPVPDWLQPLVDEVSQDLKIPFNSMLVRLYFDGGDEIAWHTDGRTFLGSTPTIASMSFGAKATFQMRRMHNVWPPLDGSAGDCIDRDTPQRDFVIGDGDMLVMRGATQKHWHHRVPKERGRRPRLNINFRYILGGPDAERGQKTYYKYMVHGDEEQPRSFSYKEIMTMRGGMLNFARPKVATKKERKRNCKSTGQTSDAAAFSAASKSTPIANDGDDKTVPEFLSSEKHVDESTFLSLPGDIRKELLGEWKARQGNQQPQQRGAVDRSINGSSSGGMSVGKEKGRGRMQQANPGDTASKRQKRNSSGGVSTLDTFFSCSKK